MRFYALYCTYESAVNNMLIILITAGHNSYRLLSFEQPRMYSPTFSLAKLMSSINVSKDKSLNVSSSDTWWKVLRCLKPMYGLNDAPLAWQLVLQEYFIKKRQAVVSVFDDCFYFWPAGPGEIKALATSHVDDNGVGSDRKWLQTEFKAFEVAFGGATKHALPYTHTGIEYSDTERGRCMDQNEFCQKLKPFPLTKERSKHEDAGLEPAELTGFRAILGGLLWLCQTRLDLICDVVLQQQNVSKATIGSLKAANSIVTKAKKYSYQVGLYFPKLPPPLKLAAVCDSSHASKNSSYAQEGIMILLMSDGQVVTTASDSPHYKQVLNAQQDMGGYCHVVASLSHKANEFRPPHQPQRHYPLLLARRLLS